MDGSSMHVQEDSQHQCRLQCDALLRLRQASAQAGAKGLPRATRRSSSWRSRCSVAREQGFRGTFSAEFLATFRAQPASVPGTLRPLRAKTLKTQRLRRWEAKASTEIVWHRNSTPTRSGLQFKHFLARRCRETSHAHNGAL